VDNLLAPERAASFSRSTSERRPSRYPISTEHNPSACTG
jgi:hypothetical protein